MNFLNCYLFHGIVDLCFFREFHFFLTCDWHNSYVNLIIYLFIVLNSINLLIYEKSIHNPLSIGGCLFYPITYKTIILPLKQLETI